MTWVFMFVSLAAAAMTLTVILDFLVSWSVHLSMTKEYSERYAWGNFSRLKMELGTHNWTRNPTHPKSLFDRTTNSEIHAGIVRFDGRGMLLGPLQYLWLLRFLRAGRYRPKQTVDWSKP